MSLFQKIRQHVAGGVEHHVPEWGATFRLRMITVPQWLAIRDLNPFKEKPEDEAGVDQLPFAIREQTIKKMQAYRAAIVAASAVDPETDQLAFVNDPAARVWLEEQPIGVLDPIAIAVLEHSRILKPEPADQAAAVGADPTVSPGSSSKNSRKAKKSSESGSTG